MSLEILLHAGIEPHELNCFEVKPHSPGYTKPMPEWVVNLPQLRRVILSHPQSWQRQKRWLAVAYLYFRCRLTRAHVAEELGTARER